MEDDDEGYDNIQDIRCNVQKNKQKTELILAANVIIIDEAFSLNKYVLLSAINSYDGFKGKIILLLMDRGQTAPVVKNGSRQQTVDSTILNLSLWNEIDMSTFSVNLRLRAMQNANALDPHYIRQLEYAKSLIEIRTNGPFRLDGPVQEICVNEISGEKKLVFMNQKYFTNFTQACNWLYPLGWKTAAFEDRAILATTNSAVDEWNAFIQNMNPSDTHVLLSANELDDVDDDLGILSGMLNADTLEYYSKPGIPIHRLELKEGDICFLLRTVSKGDGLSKNTRVRIVRISAYRILVRKLEGNRSLHIISRLRFLVPHYSGFTLIRTQFPLGLAYAMTKNKSQGQSIVWLLNDIRGDAFAHGQEYVSESRPIDVDQVAFFASPEQVDSGHVIFSNVVYSELFA